MRLECLEWSDRLTDFSRPVSGFYYFAPSINALNELVGPEEKD